MKSRSSNATLKKGRKKGGKIRVFFYIICSGGWGVQCQKQLKTSKVKADCKTQRNPSEIRLGIFSL